MPRNKVMEFITRVGLVGANYKNCPWMGYAIGELGVTEQKDKKRVEEYKEKLITGDNPWCACFAHWCMKQAGVDPTRAGSLAGAKSWLTWGRPLTGPRFGAVTVLERPPDPTKGHISFYVGEYDDQILLLGGNQGNAEVCVISYAKSRLLGYRWSNKAFGGEH